MFIRDVEEEMYPSADARQLAVLLRISRDLDVCGDVTATVDNPSELLAWATILTDPAVLAWQARDSGCRYVQVTADHKRAPIRGRVSAVLEADQHSEFWDALGLHGLEPDHPRVLAVADLAKAWEVMPVTPPEGEPPPRPPRAR